ncbi:MAG: DNA polymerase I [Acidobacteria bacterium]|nr:DNA polymerase I [Acidobacteriota bacterium]
MAKTLLLIDGSNNLFRSYYAIRALTNSAGLATNAVYGFALMLRKILKDYKPDAVGVAFDIGRKTFRHRQFEAYKKDRKPMPEDLRPQVPLIHELCAAFGFPILTSEEYEADDLLGALAKQAAAKGWNVVLATSDKDYFQLVGDGVTMFHTGRDKVYDAKLVEEDYGLPPEKVVDVMAIMGDAIDGIPGVAGIGEKGAKELIKEFGSLDAIYARLDEVKKPAQRKKLEESKDNAFLSRDLATIRTEIDTGLDIDALAIGEPDREKLHDLFSRLEFGTLLQEYLPKEPETPTDIVRTSSASEIEELCKGAKLVAIGVESTDDADRALDLISFSTGSGRTLVAAVPELHGAISKVLGGHHAFVTHDAKRLLHACARHGLTQPSHLDDTMLESYVLNPGAFAHDLGTLSREKLAANVTERKEIFKHRDEIGFEQSLDRRAGDSASVAARLHALQMPELEKEPSLAEVYRTLELPLVPVLQKMEAHGILVDSEFLLGMSATMGAQLETLETQIYKEAGEKFNINSPAQLGTILFEKLKYPVLKKTAKTKSWSTGQEVLEELAGMGFAVPRLIIEHRELHKLKSTYVDALPTLVDDNGRIHTSFNQAVAATGRLSSSDPNLQNIPVRTAQGREIRKAFRAADGFVLLAADYSQIELRVLAHMCGDEGLIDAFRRGADIHRATAAAMFGVAEALVNSEQRRAAKTINFGVLYGMSAFRLASELGISQGDAKKFIDNYFGRYPKIRELLDRTLDEARTTGKVTTMFGRVRYIPEINNKAFPIRSNAERMATNAPMQGTAADILKLAMIELDRAIADAEPEARMLLTVHDEIVIEVPESRAEKLAKVVTETMEGVRELSVPLSVDAGWGRTWYDAKL